MDCELDVSAVSVDRGRLIKSVGVISHLHDRMDERARGDKRGTLLTQIEENITRSDRIGGPENINAHVVPPLREAHGSDQ